MQVIYFSFDICCSFWKIRTKNYFCYSADWLAASSSRYLSPIFQTQWEIGEGEEGNWISSSSSLIVAWMCILNKRGWKNNEAAKKQIPGGDPSSSCGRLCCCWAGECPVPLSPCPEIARGPAIGQTYFELIRSTLWIYELALSLALVTPLMDVLGVEWCSACLGMRSDPLDHSSPARSSSLMPFETTKCHNSIVILKGYCLREIPRDLLSC